MAAALRLPTSVSIRVGLGKSRINLLEAKKIRCFHRDDLGHMATRCTAENVSEKCFRCRHTGHLIAACPGRAANTKNREVNSANAADDSANQAAAKETVSLTEAASVKA